MQPRIQLLGGVPATVNTPVTFTQKTFFNGGAQGSVFQVGASQVFQGTNAQDGEIFFNTNGGLIIQAKAGTAADLAIYGPGGTSLLNVSHGSLVINIPGGVFFGGGSVLSTYTKDQAWTPVPSGFTIVNGTGAVTFAGTYTQLGNLVFWEIDATLTGTATLAAVFGTSTFQGMPWTVLNQPNYPATACDNNAPPISYPGGVLQYADVYSPTIGATHGGGKISWTGVQTL